MKKNYIVDRRHDSDRRHRESDLATKMQTKWHQTEDTVSTTMERRRNERRTLPDDQSQYFVFETSKTLLDYFSQMHIPMGAEIETEFNESGHIKKVYLH